jgi:anti-sigma B factor antagonist
MRELLSMPKGQHDERTIRAGPLTVEIVPSDGTVMVQLQGELDGVGAPTLERELSDLLSANPESLVVDLARLEFIDSIGLRCLLTVTEQAKTSGNTLQFLAPTGQVENVLEITELRHRLPFLD